jgi:hypothetical protein
MAIQLASINQPIIACMPIQRIGRLPGYLENRHPDSRPTTIEQVRDRRSPPGMAR